MATRRLLAGVSAVAIVVLACGSTAPGSSPVPPLGQPSSSPVAGPATPAATAIPTAVPETPTAVPATPTPVPPLVITDLPRVKLADVTATAVCDPEPGQAFSEGGEPTLFCSDAIEVALAVVSTVTPDPVTRLYVQFPECAVNPCTDDELSTGEATLWTAGHAYSVRLDSRLDTVPPATVVTNDSWPSSGGSPEPAVVRPSIKDAPREVARREPYPFCGRAGDELQEPDVLGCFRDAVLTGRRAEMIERLYATEGGEILWLYRYDGNGRLVRYQRFGTEWLRSEGAMLLGVTPPAWDFDPWVTTKLSS